jgi:transcriptional regulator with XRE-family HTH domain
MQYHELLAEFIKAKRQEKKVSLNSFAIVNGIEPSTLSRIENHKLEIKIPVLFQIAEGFDMSPSELLKEFENTLKE